MSYRRLVLLLVLSCLLAYTARQLQLALPDRPAARALGLAFFALALAWPFLYHLLSRGVGSRGVQALAWVGSVGMGVWATFILLSLPLNVGSLVAGPAPDGVVLALLGVSLLLAALGLRQALAGPRVVEVRVPIAGLPDALRGLRIVQLSDLHVGPTIRRAYVQEVVDAVAALEPDLIALTGDLGDGTPSALREALEPLKGLKARLGAYFVTGNHEYYWGPKEWLAEISSLGLVPLLNENRILREGEEAILVAGVTDTSAHHFLPEHRSDPARAAASPEPAALKILLAHRPDSCLAAEPAGFDLQLSGHTHAGQFFPFTLIARWAHRYFQGLHRHGRLWLYVNSGTGYWGPPHRFAVPAEITLLHIG